MHRRQTSRVTNDQLGTQEMVCGRLHRPRQNPTCVTDLTVARPKLSRRQPRWREVDTSLQPSDKQPRQSCERRSRFVLHDFPAQPLFRRLARSVSRHLVKKTTFRQVLGRQRPLHRPQSDISYRKNSTVNTLRLVHEQSSPSPSCPHFVVCSSIVSISRASFLRCATISFFDMSQSQKSIQNSRATHIHNTILQRAPAPSLSLHAELARATAAGEELGRLTHISEPLKLCLVLEAQPGSTQAVI